jgi:hypothetical protein
MHPGLLTGRAARTTCFSTQAVAAPEAPAPRTYVDYTLYKVGPSWSRACNAACPSLGYFCLCPLLIVSNHCSSRALGVLSRCTLCCAIAG